MQKLNITLMLSIAAISACLGIYLFMAEARGIAYWATSTVSLLATSAVSLAYAARLLRVNVKSAKAQAIIFFLYIATLIAAAIIGGGGGSIPYIMQSMGINFIAALGYIWPTLVLGGAIATISYALTTALISRKDIS